MAAILATVPVWAQSTAPPLPDLPVNRLERLTAPAQTPTLAVTQLAERGGLEARSLSLTFPRPLPVRDVLLVLVRDTPYSVVADADVGGTFVGELRRLTMRQALEALLFPAGLDYAVTGTVIRVFPRRTETRLFELDLLPLRRSWQSRSPGGQEGGFTTALDSDVFSELDAGVRAMLSPAGRHHVDRRAGLVQVTDLPDRLDQIGVYLERAQIRAARQIRLEIRVLQFWPSNAAGLSLDALAGREGTGVRAAAGAPAGVLVEDPGAFAAALAAHGSVQTIAAPRMISLNNEAAYVRVQTGGGAESPTGGPGLTLVVVPSISADGLVQLSISPRYTDAPDVSFTAGSGSPVTTSEADVLVRVRDRETVVLAGLPGRLAGHGDDGGASATRPGARAELIVLVTPALVGPPALVSGATRNPEAVR